MILVLGCSATPYGEHVCAFVTGKRFSFIRVWLPMGIFKHCNAGIVLLPNPKLNEKKNINCKDLQGKTLLF